MRPEHPVWGIDPSTRRVALAVVLPAGGFVHRTLELGPGVVDPHKLAYARATMHAWFSSLAEEYDPGWLWVEEPFGGGGGKGRRSNVPPQSQWMLAMVMEAAYSATGAVANLLQPAVWKAECGVGGHARKARILEWARGLGYLGSCDLCLPDGSCKGSLAHDEADALGIGVAGVSLVGGVSAVSGKVNTR